MEKINFIKTLKSSKLYRLEAVLIVCAIVTALIGSMKEKSDRENFKASLDREMSLTPILAAKQEVKYGALFRKEMFTEINVPSGSKSRNMMTLDQAESIIGKPSTVNLLPGDPILLTMVGGSTSNRSVADNIPPGMRLFTLSIDEPAVSNGFIRVHDHVDVIGHMDMGARGPTSFTMLSNVELIAVGKETDPTKSPSASQVSFLVTPSEMEKLTFAQTKGSFRLALRSPEDQKAVDSTSGVDMQTFKFSDEVIKAAQPAPEKIVGK